ncbi:ATP-binding protein [Pseudohalocynthiibacter sp. F2068]|jgi:PAS domain S-box-containing protein|uniref:ATP-binding protein n=1 Tax=Pseudohalocynthiibacter sp. F2068 TaxID=2926418 RepID=UPI001FF641EE|nr:ATP-binding protein [Pseudohalocynthiibacter sp. F2068]MCK0102776.1 PAS-domain containing protein [Pseudohalocynthiibacter sp. F2068]
MTSTLENQTPDTAEVLRDAVEALSEGIAVFDANLRLITCNQRYLEMFPLIRELIVPGAHSDDLLRAGVERGQFAAALNDPEGWLDKAYKFRLEFDREFEVEFTDGKTYQVRFKPTRSGGYVVSRSDITESRRTEAMVRDRETLLATVLDTSPVSVVMARIEDGKIIYRSKEAAANFGQTTFAHEHYTSPEEREKYVALLTQKKRVDGYQMTSVRADGSSYTSSCSGRIVEYGGELCAVSALTDLTEQLEKDALIRHVLEACPIPIQMSKADTSEVLFCSPETVALFGDAPSSKSFYVDPKAREIYVDTLRKDGVVRDYKAEFYNRHGTRFWGAVFAQMIRYNGDDVIVSHTRDMTEQLKIEDELITQRELLHQNEKMFALGELLAGVAHELNNPLSVVVGHSLMLREDAQDPEILRQVKKISDAAERCTKIVRTFLTMARQQPAKSEKIEINEIVQTAVDVARYGDFGSTIKMECDLAQTLPSICADSDQITQVILNLIINAEQAIRSEGKGDKIVVKTSQGASEQTVEIEVKDNGPGIPAKYQNRIFEPFFTTKDVGEGTGIGLSLCHRVIRSHGGQIMLDGNYKEGTLFRISLPAKPASDGACKSVPEVETPQGSLRILIVDDEEDVAELNAEILGRAGFGVDVANIGGDAISKLRQNRYDLILSDLNMPGIDGRGFFETITKDFPEMAQRIGFVTGDTMGRSSQGFLKEANRPYLEKPVSPKELRAFVSEIIAIAENEK